MKERTYIAIDLKSFYASVECVERGLDPLDTNLVVADESRTEKTICLAVSPSMKKYGIPGRARLFEVVQKVGAVNAARRAGTKTGEFSGESFSAKELEYFPEMGLSYITAVPRMALYMEYSTRIYEIYLKYVAPEDIHVYSIDEVFMDVTSYLAPAGKTAREFAVMIIRDVLGSTGITATAGIGSNLYLCKVAMDIVAKHVKPDADGVRIAELDEMSYRRKLWGHRPITDFWRVGRGYAKKLEKYGIYTMGDVARCSLGGAGDFHSEELLYKLFGVNAELLIDHAWGWEPCTIADIKAYRPESNSIGAGQVLQCPYTFGKARLVVREMADMLALDLVEKRLVTDQLVLTVGYDVESLSDPEIRKLYNGQMDSDHYGRAVPKHAHGTANLGRLSSSSKLIIDSVSGLYDRIVNPKLLVRRIWLCANRVLDEGEAGIGGQTEQLDMFTDYNALEAKREEESGSLAKERRMQEAIITIKKKFGKNAVLKGMNFEEGATAASRNEQIGGHKA